METRTKVIRVRVSAERAREFERLIHGLKPSNRCPVAGDRIFLAARRIFYQQRHALAAYHENREE